MGNNPQSLIRDDEEFNTPRDRGPFGGSESLPRGNPVALPPMALIVDAILWPEEGSQVPSMSKLRSDDTVKKPAERSVPLRRQRIWCTVSVDGRDLGPPIAFPKIPGKRIPLKVEQRNPMSQLVLRFSREDPLREEANQDVYPEPANEDENNLEGEEPEEEDWQLSLTTGPLKPQKKRKEPTIQFPLSSLVRYGVPLYTTLCLGVPLDGETALKLDLAEALQRGQLVDSPKVTITLFRPARPRDFYDLHAEPQPDIHATLVEDLEPLPMCAPEGKRAVGPTCATQIKGLTRALRLMSTVAYSLQDAHFSGVPADSNRELHAEITANDQLCCLQEELQASQRETSRLQAELDQVSTCARLQEERLEKELARACGELQDRQAECQAKSRGEEQVEFLTRELEHAHERVRLLNKGKEQWHYELVRKYTDLEAQHTTTCAEKHMISVEYQVAQESLKQKDVALRQKDSEIQDLVEFRQAQEALQEETELLKAEQDLLAQKWQKEKLELLRASNQEKAVLQDELLKKTEELQALRRTHRPLKLTDTQELEASQSEFVKLQTEAQEAKQMLEATRFELQRAQNDLADVLAEREVLRAGESLRQELQLENLQLRDEIKSLKARECMVREDLREELSASRRKLREETERGWNELQSLREAAKDRNKEVESARTDLDAWSRQNGQSTPLELTSSQPASPELRPRR
mmetsp:Transcript_104130/g.180894  ORF Transcript_104130/g.180894 Transcript_104130/m.180894 type:complete len:696 (-) Transcript_104130:10-2097(-)